jgi:hypothetical protein
LGVVGGDEKHRFGEWKSKTKGLLIRAAFYDNALR